jgi:hypothetical protein
MTQKPKSKPLQDKAKPVKAKPVKTLASPMNVSQMQIQPRADNTGIHITITYQGCPIHTAVLTAPEYQTWKCMTQSQKFAYVRAKTNPEVFCNNQRIVNIVVNATMNLLDAIFARLKAQT